MYWEDVAMELPRNRPPVLNHKMKRCQEPCGPCVFACVAIWPVEGDLLVATDIESTCFSDDTEPVMYLSEDA